MKAILEFDLTDPDDRMEHMRCVKSLDMACALFEIVVNMDKSVDVPEPVKEYINSQLNNNGINIEELIA